MEIDNRNMITTSRKIVCSSLSKGGLYSYRY